MKLDRNFGVENTLGLKAQSLLGCTVRSVDELKAVMAGPEFLNLQPIVFGSGSNVFAMPLVEKLIIKMRIKEFTELKKIRSLFGSELVPAKIGIRWSGLC